MNYQYKSKSTANLKEIETKLSEYIETLKDHNETAVFMLSLDNKDWNAHIHATYGQIGEMFLMYAMSDENFKKIILSLADVFRNNEN